MAKLTVKATSNRKIQETIAINILKIPVAEITITKIARITEVIKMTMVIKKTETTGMEMIDGVKTSTIIHAATKEGMKNIPMATGTRTGFFITGLTGVKEINISSASLN